MGGRGFAAMPRERLREIASAGGRAAHERGRAHEFTPEEAREAGRRGGLAVSRDRAHMARIGRLGGELVSSDRDHMAEIGRRGGEAVSADGGHMAEIGRRGGLARGTSASRSLRDGDVESAGSTLEIVDQQLEELSPAEPSRDAVDAAVGWWRDALERGRTGTSGGALVDLLLTGLRSSGGADRLDAFAEALRRLARAAVDRFGDCQLSTDYGPEGLLRRACEESRFSGTFPVKTLMWVERDYTVVSCGYRARSERIHGDPRWMVRVYSVDYDLLTAYLGASEEEARSVWEIVRSAWVATDGIGSAYLTLDGNGVEDLQRREDPRT